MLIKDKDEDESLFTTFPIIYEIAQSLIQKFEIKLQKKTYKSLKLVKVSFITILLKFKIQKQKNKEKE